MKMQVQCQCNHIYLVGASVWYVHGTKILQIFSSRSLDLLVSIWYFLLKFWTINLNWIWLTCVQIGWIFEHSFFLWEISFESFHHLCTKYNIIWHHAKYYRNKNTRELFSFADVCWRCQQLINDVFFVYALVFLS